MRSPLQGKTTDMYVIITYIGRFLLYKVTPH